MLVKTSGLASILPGPGPACQPTTLMPAFGRLFDHRRLFLGVGAGVDDAVGLHRDRLCHAEVRPGTVPCPSRMRNSQPIALAASAAPSPTPCAPPLR